MNWFRPDVRVLILCTANVCRSPLAEGLLRERLRAMGLGRRVQVRSAGTRVGQRGRRPDPRVVRLADEVGVNIRGIRARQVDAAMILRSDFVLVMEQAHLRDLENLFPGAALPATVQLLSTWLPAAVAADPDILDPYFANQQGFRDVFQQLDAALEGFAAMQARSLLEAAS